MDDKKDVRFLSFYNEHDAVINGYFEVLEETAVYIKIKTSDNIVTIPWNRIVKIKEKIRGENGGTN